VIAEGAGAASRQSLGTAVFGGMIISTGLSLLVVPILYIAVGSLQERFNRNTTLPAVVPAPAEE